MTYPLNPVMITVEYEGEIYRFLAKPLLSIISNKMIDLIEFETKDTIFKFETILRQPIVEEVIEHYFLRMKIQR